MVTFARSSRKLRYLQRYFCGKMKTYDNYTTHNLLRHDFCKIENGDNLLNLTIQT